MRIFLMLAAVMAAECVEHYKLDANSLQQEWIIYKEKYNLGYDDIEDKQRFTNFLNNIELIEHHNQQYDAGVHTYSLGVNQFTHLTQEEYEKEFNFEDVGKDNFRTDTRTAPFTKSLPEYLGLPSTWDWREKGAVTPVINQGQCKAHWAFTAVGILEGVYKTGNLVPLSVQQTIDCDHTLNYGCYNGTLTSTFSYIIDAGGIVSEESYPYVGHEQEECKYNKSLALLNLNGYGGTYYEEYYAFFLVRVPLGIKVDAKRNTFKFYKKGVYNDPECGKPLGISNTYMLLIGYGNEDGQDYWLIKNAWGETWGEKGYIKLLKGKNMCAIEYEGCVFPLFIKRKN